MNEAGANSGALDTVGDPEDPHTSEELLPLVYSELRRLPACKLAREQAGQTLDATGLVHEAYLRLAAGQHHAQWDNGGRRASCVRVCIYAARFVNGLALSRQR
jgi:hypothetical protein